MDTPGLHPDHTACYRICAQGVFDVDWLDLLSGVWVICHNRPGGSGVTVLIGEVADQAALVGVIEQLYNLGFPLLLVEYLAEEETVTREKERESDDATIHATKWGQRC
jgi:hypothetical protein